MRRMKNPNRLYMVFVNGRSYEVKTRTETLTIAKEQLKVERENKNVKLLWVNCFDENRVEKIAQWMRRQGTHTTNRPGGWVRVVPA